eukprot:3932006-Rhodomonas_salina.1
MFCRFQESSREAIATPFLPESRTESPAFGPFSLQPDDEDKACTSVASQTTKDFGADELQLRNEVILLPRLHHTFHHSSLLCSGTMQRMLMKGEHKRKLIMCWSCVSSAGVPDEEAKKEEDGVQDCDDGGWTGRLCSCEKSWWRCRNNSSSARGKNPTLLPCDIRC